MTIENQPLSETQIEAAFQYLVQGRHGQPRLGMERMADFLMHFGSPQLAYPIIHVAGTNGKGSTTAYITASLAAAGLKVGMFSSPFVDRFGERIRILDGRENPHLIDSWWDNPALGEITMSEAATLIHRIQDALNHDVAPEGAHPTHFEMLTTMAFTYFAEQTCDIAVIETGIGGRLDTTNCIPSPLAAVITTIGYDHQDLLGDTLADIAKEKAGIIKPGTQVFLQDPESSDHTADEAQTIRTIFEHTAKQMNVPLTCIQQEEIEDLGIIDQMRAFTYPNTQITPYATRLLPKYQQKNAATAIATVVYLLNHLGIQKDKASEAIHRGIAAAYVPARFEKLQDHPTIIRDGGHNAQGAHVLVEALNHFYPERKIHVITAVMGDKDYSAMFDIIIKGLKLRLARIDCVAPDNHRALDPAMIQQTLYDIVDRYTEHTESYPMIRADFGIQRTLARAISEAKRDDAVIVSWGSLYQAGETRTAWAMHHASDAGRKDNT